MLLSLSKALWHAAINLFACSAILWWELKTTITKHCVIQRAAIHDKKMHALKVMSALKKRKSQEVCYSMTLFY